MTSEDVQNGSCPKPKTADKTHTESWWDGGACEACGHPGGNVVEITDKGPSGYLPPGEGD